MGEIVSVVFSQLLMMTVSMAFGYFCYKKRAFGDTSIREFAALTMQYTIPLSIALSFKDQFRPERLGDWGMVFLLSALGFLLMILLLTLVYPRRRANYRQKRMCGLIPNNAIFGLAIAQSMFGAEGVFLMSSQIVVSNILLWTYGISVLSEKPRLRSALLNPAVLGVLAGMVLVLVPAEMPEVLLNPLRQLTGLNGPVGMMLAGGYMARIDLPRCFRTPSYYWLGLCKLVLGPLLLVPFLWALPVRPAIALTVMIGLMAPTGTAAATFAEMVGMDNAFSSGSVAFNECACLLTIPLMIAAMLRIFG